MIVTGYWLRVVLLSLLLFPLASRAQLDPELRRLIQVGYNQPIQGTGPIAGYGFYYFNQPNFSATNRVLRIAVAPIYLDSELGFREALGPNTDLAVGLAGGGFAHSYSEVRRGDYRQEESFLGHGGEIASSVYHRLNPQQEIPLSFVLRGSAHYFSYEGDDKTAPSFELPDDRTAFHIRSGLRWGGQEPTLTAPLAMELSLWHESQIRHNADHYGFNRDRSIEAISHLFWARALLKLTFENEHLFEASLTTGASVHADRFSAYRLGGVLPFASEFPLSIPGYYFQELSAKEFALWNLQYSFPLTRKKNWRLNFHGATGFVNYLDSLEQPGHWHSGLGGGLTFISPSGAWLATLIYAYGFNAIRNDGHGASQIGLLFQYDFDAKSNGKSRFFMPGVSPYRSSGGERLLRR